MILIIQSEGSLPEDQFVVFRTMTANGEVRA